MLPSPSPSRWRLPIAAGLLLATALAAAPAQAAPSRAQALRADRAGAVRALDAARSAAHGDHGSRALSPALASLAGRLPALDPAVRRQAAELLARPTDPGQTGQPGGPYTVPAVEAWTDHFCFHWVESTADAPPAADADHNGFPDYVEQLADTFETVWARENGDETDGGLGWREPKSDGSRGGCAGGAQGLTDVYLKDIGGLGLYGYASPDADQPTGDATRYAYLVMDDDYAQSQFPQYDGKALPPMQVTAAHEYNHVLQYAYDILEDKWMFESTATWMEDKVFPDIDDYHQYMASWARRSLEPLTASDDAKVYGSAVFNHWLDDGYGEDIVRRAWELSTAQGSLAPAAYDKAIRVTNGPGFSFELSDLAAASAEWHARDAGVHEGAAFPDVARVAPGGQVLTLPANGTKLSGAIDHTSFALVNVAPSAAPALKLTGGLPAGTAGAIALVGRDGDSEWRTVGALPQGGQTTVTLNDPGRFDRITAVVVNSDYANTGWTGQDWHWTHDDAPFSVALTATSASTGGGGSTPGGGGSTPGGGPTGGGGGGTTTGGGSTGGGVIHGGTTTPVTTPVTTPAAPLLRLAPAGKPRLKAASVVLKAEASTAGTFKALARVDAKTAKRIGLGRKAATIGSGSAKLATAGSAKLTLRLTGKARARLKRQRGAVTIAVQVTFTPASGRPATQTLRLVLRR